jgi:L,D-peptidoglycan transpeptidase YkuD (ErfK/YbiS/YcfS/YnhG family)
MLNEGRIYAAVMPHSSGISSLGKLFFSAAVFFMAVSLRAQEVVPVREALGPSRQMVVVMADDWKATNGWLRRFERIEAGWQIEGTPFRVALGRSGLGWGRGLQPSPLGGPQKKEGDGRSPAGIFYLPYAFGYAAPDAVRAIKLPYVQCTGTVECVDDTNSLFYNIIMDRRSVGAPDWHSSEKMRRNDDLYRLGVFVGHNSSPAQPGVGSCIFLHSWKGPDKPTSGCTAMSEGAIETLLGWLEPQSHPVLVQLPEAEYRLYQTVWQLPEIQFTNTTTAAGVSY